jgi:uncharacterized membrane protein YeaQ/YmgE (transglycosylase-associated protein family)
MLGCEGILSKRLGSPYVSGRTRHWLKFKNPAALAVKREADVIGGQDLSPIKPTDLELTKWDVEMATSDQERKWEQHLERVGEPEVRFSLKLNNGATAGLTDEPMRQYAREWLRKRDLEEGMAMEEQQVGWIAAIIIGGIAGWLADQFMKSQMGLLMNIVLGIIGAAVASWLFGLLGITFAGWIGYLIAGFIGACILIAIARAFSSGLQPRT